MNMQPLLFGVAVLFSDIYIHGHLRALFTAIYVKTLKRNLLGKHKFPINDFCRVIYFNS